MPATAESSAKADRRARLLAEVRRLCTPSAGAQARLACRRGHRRPRGGGRPSLPRAPARGGGLHTLWAEDGKIFLTDALNRSTFDALVRTYNGYLLVAARTIASVTVLLPVRYAAAVLSGAGAVGAAAMAAIGYHASAPHISSRPVRLALAAFVVLLPSSIREVENNVANLHWYLIYAGFWLLLWTSRRTWDVAVSSVVLAFAALSDPLTVLLLPMAGIRLAFVRDRKRLIPPACFLVALVLQLVAVVTHRSGRFIHHHITWARTLIGYVHRGLVEAFFQGPGWGANPRHILVDWIVLAIVLGAMLVTAFLRPNRALLLTLLVVMSFVFYVVPVRISGYSVPRYWVLPAWFAITALGVCANEALGALGTAKRRLPRRGFAFGLLAVAALDLALSYPAYGARARGPTWEEGLAMARADCAQGARTVAVPISPRVRHGYWQVALPCNRLST